MEMDSAYPSEQAVVTAQQFPLEEIVVQPCHPLERMAEAELMHLEYAMHSRVWNLRCTRQTVLVVVYWMLNDAGLLPEPGPVADRGFYVGPSMNDQ